MSFTVRELGLELDDDVLEQIAGRHCQEHVIDVEQEICRAERRPKDGQRGVGPGLCET